MSLITASCKVILCQLSESEDLPELLCKCAIVIELRARPLVPIFYVSGWFRTVAVS